MHVLLVCGVIVDWRDVMAGLRSFLTSTTANGKESRGYDAQNATDSATDNDADIEWLDGWF
jgi:hypothetical protein